MWVEEIKTKPKKNYWPMLFFLTFSSLSRSIDLWRQKWGDAKSLRFWWRFRWICWTEKKYESKFRLSSVVLIIPLTLVTIGDTIESKSSEANRRLHKTGEFGSTMLQSFVLGTHLFDFICRLCWIRVIWCCFKIRIFWKPMGF